MRATTSPPGPSGYFKNGATRNFEKYPEGLGDEVKSNRLSLIFHLQFCIYANVREQVNGYKINLKLSQVLTHLNFVL